jgi:transcriptional regulator with XRE-family HTH domain
VNSKTAGLDLVELRQRLRECVAKAGSGVALAEAAGVPRRSLENYLNGTSEPKLSVLAAIARAAGVSLAWLATGTTEGGTSSSGDAGVLRPEVLENAIRIVERWLDAHRRVMQPEKKAAAILAIYEMIAQDIEEGRPPLDERRAGAILKLVA